MLLLTLAEGDDDQKDSERVCIKKIIFVKTFC